MKNPFLYTAIALITLSSVATGFAKDDKKKEKGKDVVVLVDRDGRRYIVDRDGQRHWVDDKNRDQDRQRDDRDDRDGRRDYGGGPEGRPRIIYVIERDRPVERSVYVDRDGRYYRWQDGRRIYVAGRHFDSFPSKYYHSDGRRRVTITLPF